MTQLLLLEKHQLRLLGNSNDRYWGRYLAHSFETYPIDLKAINTTRGLPRNAVATKNSSPQYSASRSLTV